MSCVPPPAYSLDASMRTHPMPLMLLAFIIVACDSFGPNDVALSLTTDKASYQLAEEAILVTVVNESPAPVYVGACLWPERRVGDGWVALAESELSDVVVETIGAEEAQEIRKQESRAA